MSYYDILPVNHTLRISWGRVIKIQKPSLGMMLEWIGISKTLALLESLFRTEKTFRVRLNYAATINTEHKNLAVIFVVSLPWYLTAGDLLAIRKKVSSLIVTQEKEAQKKTDSPARNNPNWVQDIVDFLRYNAGMSKAEVLGMYMDEAMTALHNIRRERQEWANIIAMAYHDPKGSKKILDELSADRNNIVPRDKLKDMEAEFLDGGKKNGK